MIQTHTGNPRRNIAGPVLMVVVVLLVIGGLIALLFGGIPKWRVWQKELSGKSQLREAEWSRRIQVEEAAAEKDAAALKAEAEVERAKGVAEANEIIAGGLQGNEEYLRYLWIEKLDQGNSEVIYVPTEAGLPILEAGKRVYSNEE